MDKSEGFAYFVIPEIHGQQHIRGAANVHRIVVVFGVEDVNVPVVTRRNQIIFEHLDADRSGATRTRLFQGTRLRESNFVIAISKHKFQLTVKLTAKISFRLLPQ